MTSDTITISVDGHGVAVVAIDQPERPINLLTAALAQELLATIERIAADDTLKGAVLTSTKPGSFLHGADLREFVGVYESGLTPAQARVLSRGFQHVVRRMETCGKLFVAALNGPALGGGLELALGCHYRLLADDPAAMLGLPEVTTGLIPGGGGTQRLPRLIGIERALPLLLSGRAIAPAEALALGIVDALAPADHLIAEARMWMSKTREAVQPWDRRSFSLPGGAGPSSPSARRAFMVGTAQVRAQTQGKLPAPRALLSSVYEGTITDIDTGLRVESNYFGQLLAGPVARNLMRTSFLNKQAAEALEHRPRGVARSRVRALGVVGAGEVGAGVAEAAARAGIEVVLLDQTRAAAEAGKGHIERRLAAATERDDVSSDQAAALLRRITPITEYTQLGSCELVVEAVYENRDLKREVIQRAEAHLPVHAVFASATSTLPISGLAQASLRPAQLVGLHFASPVDRVSLVEVIVGGHTSQETLCRALDFAALLGKTPIVVHDRPAFYTTRVLSTFIDEGACMLLEGVAPALIENAARRADMPMGPLAQLDEVGQELSWQLIAQARADGLPASRTRADAAPVIERMIALDRRGRRHGAGFYEYPEGGAKRLWPGLREHFPVRAEQPAAEELEARFLTIQALESARCLEDGVVTSAADADLGAVLGIGYPAWTGGPLTHVDTQGLQRFVRDCERLAAVHGPRYAPSAWLEARAAAGVPFHPPTPAPAALAL